MFFCVLGLTYTAFTRDDSDWHNNVLTGLVADVVPFMTLSVLPRVVQIGLCHLSIVLKATYQKWKNRKEPRPSKEAAADVVVSAK